MQNTVPDAVPGANERITILGKVYLTGKSPRALWQRLRFWLTYSRPVTYRDLRRIAHAAAYPHPDPRDPKLPDLSRPDPAGEALFNRVIREAEKPVFGRR